MCIFYKQLLLIFLAWVLLLYWVIRIKKNKRKGDRFDAAVKMAAKMAAYSKRKNNKVRGDLLWTYCC